MGAVSGVAEQGSWLKVGPPPVQPPVGCVAGLWHRARALLPQPQQASLEGVASNDIELAFMCLCMGHTAHSVCPSAASKPIMHVGLAR
jgi:hypothetical protein